MKRLLVIGCGRSGTRYTAKVLRRLDLDIGHEKDGDDGQVSWRAVPAWSRSEYPVVIHQVREPLSVISSFHTVMSSSWKFICENEPRIEMKEPLLVRCMKYWLYWNQKCSGADFRFRVEDMNTELPSILDSIGMNYTKGQLMEALEVPKNDHTRKAGHKASKSYLAITLEDMNQVAPWVTNEIIKQAKIYGYNL